jgi:hypothetical protein
MRFYGLKYLLAFLVTVALLIGALSYWIYEPASGKSPGQIATSLLEYHNLTATNGLGDLGTELPGSLMLYHKNWNNCHHSGPDFAEAGYYYYRLGMYFERYFDLRRDLPGGNTWTLTCNVRALFPIIGLRCWTQRLITIDDRTFSISRYGGQSNSIPGDAAINRSLHGTWHTTVYAAENGWNEEIVIGTNGDYCATSFFVTQEDGKEFGRVQVLNGVLTMTITNQILDRPSPIISKLPYTEHNESSKQTPIRF